MVPVDYSNQKKDFTVFLILLNSSNNIQILNMLFVEEIKTYNVYMLHIHVPQVTDDTDEHTVVSTHIGE